MKTRNSHHDWLMSTYYSARQAWLDALEYETMLYPVEVAEFKARNQQPLFKDFLIAQRWSY